jgi:hypothetical protein
VFPSERRLGDATPMSGWSKLMTRLREASAVAGVGLHDLRRTYRSILADLGVREEIAEAMIAHRRSGLVARYNRAELWDQRREAAEKLDVWVTSVVSRVEGDEAPNVVPISRPGRPADDLRPSGSVIPLRELGRPAGGGPGPVR